MDACTLCTKTARSHAWARAFSPTAHSIHEAMALTIRVLQRFHRAVQDHAADRVRVVATAALRDSRNSRAFLDWVRSATGWKAEVITGLEEGRLIHLGILSQRPHRPSARPADRPRRR